MNGCFLTAGPNIFVFSEKKMRKYTTLKVEEYTRTSGITVASYLTTENYLSFKSIDASKTVYTFCSTSYFATPALTVAFDQPHNGTGNARMKIFGTFTSTLNVWSVLFFHGGD